MMDFPVSSHAGVENRAIIEPIEYICIYVECRELFDRNQISEAPFQRDTLKFHII